jgi:hypothetical protein
MKRLPILVALLGLVTTATATRPWTEPEFRLQERTFRLAPLPRPDSLPRSPRRFNYLERIKLMADFVAALQVADSTSPDYGGIIEAEHMPGVIETDNTQEAIWVWSRWYELTGHDDYRENVRRAWTYVLNYPAYREHGGNPASIWYAVWNCGLGFMAEAGYRHAYGDSTFRAYADSCRDFYVANPLDTWNTRDNFVTSQSSGMAYDYALEFGDAELRDTAVTRGARVQTWIEQDAAGHLAQASWAMSGGTAMWGVVNTVCREDTVAGRAWVETYVESLPGFYPTGTWNCSHNIWLANAYRACAELTSENDWWLMHQYLVDTLLMLDTDRDGGIPATWTDPDTRDQTWVSTYMHFMGFDVFTTPTFDLDASVLAFVSPDPRGLYIVGDTIPVMVPVANVGLDPTPGWNLGLFIGGRCENKPIPPLDFLAIDTITGSPYVPEVPGQYQAIAIGHPAGDENPLNDSVRMNFKVHGMFTISGTITDSASASPIHAWLKVTIAGDTVIWDSCETNRSGEFDLAIIDTTVTILLEPSPPYYTRSWDFTILGDTTIALVTQPAHVMVVNNDPAADYARYYTTTLDTLGHTHFTWERASAGPPDWGLVNRLRTPTVIYYSGDAVTSTVPAEDRDSLLALSAHGINLLLTGQDVCEELAGTRFLEDLCGVSFDSSGWTRFFAFGNRADSLGATIGVTATAGGDGANNQTSRDVLGPMRNGASVLMVYDTVSNVGAAIRRPDHATGTRTITLGYGFESVNQPTSRPGFLTRVQLMDRFLDWFGIATGVAEPGNHGPVDRLLYARPNPFRDRVHLGLGPGRDRPRVITIYDATGRAVTRLPINREETTWDARAVPVGIYFVIPGPGYGPVRVVKTR